MIKNKYKEEAKSKGLHKFFDGIPCKNGHISERYTRNSACVECSIKNSNMYDLDYRKEYTNKNKKRIADFKKEYREKNKDKLAIESKKYREKNKERLKELYKIYRLKNVIKIREKVKKWALENKEKALLNAKISQSNRRARKLNATPKWANKEKIRDIYKNCPLGFDVDHIIPLAGKTVCGLHVEYNLQYLDSFENKKKAASLIF